MISNSPFIYTELRDFFEQNRSFLESYYPGIKLNRILEDFVLWCENFGAKKVDIHSETWEAALAIFKAQLFLDKLLKGIPLEYIVEKSYFYNSYFSVNSNVLIPRYETEILVELAKEIILSESKSTTRTFSIMDVATGSGCILLALLKELKTANIKAYASDLSLEALMVAKQNYENLKNEWSVAHEVNFLHMDRLDGFNEKLDIIISNPPYIMESMALSDVHQQVDRYEPKMALYLPNDSYYEWFSTFFGHVLTCLKPGGRFLMEGHEETLENLKIMALDLGFDEVKVIRDLCGQLRFLQCKVKDL